MDKAEMNHWSEEMWQVWDKDSGIYHVDDVPYEYGLSPDGESVCLRPKGKESPVVCSDVRRDDPSYVDGTDEFRAVVEAARLIYNVRAAKVVAGKLATV